MLAGSGLGPDYLREHSAALGAVDAEEVAAVAEQFAPTGFAAVLLGDASVITESVETIRPLATSTEGLAVQLPALSRSTVDRCWMSAQTPIGYGEAWRNGGQLLLLDARPARPRHRRARGT